MDASTVLYSYLSTSLADSLYLEGRICSDFHTSLNSLIAMFHILLTNASFSFFAYAKRLASSERCGTQRHVQSSESRCCLHLQSVSHSQSVPCNFRRKSTRFELFQPRFQLSRNVEWNNKWRAIKVISFSYLTYLYLLISCSEDMAERDSFLSPRTDATSLTSREE